MTTRECDFYRRLGSRLAGLAATAMELSQGGRGNSEQTQQQREQLMHGLGNLSRDLGLLSEPVPIVNRKS